VANDAGLIICQLCVAKAAQIFDEEVDVDYPQDWSTRWPLKQSARTSRHVPSPRASASRSIQFEVVIHSDWSTSPQKRWSAEARFAQDTGSPLRSAGA
jgi:hypothetical protein